MALTVTNHMKTIPGIERRRHRRVKVTRPLRATIAGTPVYVLDASIGGVRILHTAQFSEGLNCRMEIPSEYGPISLDCRIVRTTATLSRRVIADPLFQSGLTILAADRQSTERLRALFP